MIQFAEGQKVGGRAGTQSYLSTSTTLTVWDHVWGFNPIQPHKETRPQAQTTRRDTEIRTLAGINRRGCSLCNQLRPKHCSDAWNTHCAQNFNSRPKGGARAPRDFLPPLDTSRKTEPYWRTSEVRRLRRRRWAGKAGREPRTRGMRRGHLRLKEPVCHPCRAESTGVGNLPGGAASGLRVPLRVRFAPLALLPTVELSSVQFSRSVMLETGLKAQLPCSPQTEGAQPTKGLRITRRKKVTPDLRAFSHSFT